MRRTPWFRSWFGDEYLAIYPHRDREEAREAVDLLLETTGHGSGTPVLDLACGAGRHVSELIRAGLDATGLDLSPALLRRARELEPAAHLVRGDMRCIPFAAGSFHVVTNFFTSFGYFQDAEDDRTVLAEARRVLTGGGHFFLDFLNAEHVRSELTERDVRHVDAARVIQERRLLDGDRVVEKRITIQGTGEGPRTFVERVRLYGPDELREMLREARLLPERSFGDYRGAPHGPGAPRFIVTGRAS